MPLDILIGTDPEVFVQNKITKEFLSAHEYFPGTKEAPFPVRDGAIQVDGVAAEFNITPADNFKDFAGYIGSVTGVMQMMLQNQNPDLELVVAPTATFTRAYFDSLPEDTKKLGCSPDYDAWTKLENKRPETDRPFRTGAGHIHVGWMDVADVTDEEYLDVCREVVKTLDCSLFIMSQAWDDDRTRRSLYGKKGAFRPKLYGLEYRVLSNMYLHKPAIVKWVFEAAMHSARLVLEEKHKIFNHSYARRYLPISVLTENELFNYNSFLVTYGYDPLPRDIIEGK